MTSTVLGFVIIWIITVFILAQMFSINNWIRAVYSGVKVDISQLAMMRIRKSPIKNILNSVIKLNKNDISVTVEEFEKHYLAGGNLENITNGLIKAKNQGQELSFSEAAILDLSGKNIEYHLKKKLIESKSGIDVLRQQLSDAILKKLDVDQVKEIARVIENMKAH